MDAADLARIAALEMKSHGLQPVFAPEALREAERGRRRQRRAGG